MTQRTHEENGVKRLSVAALLFPIALWAGAEMPQMTAPAMQAETWVKESLKLAKAKGGEALVAEVKNPKGKFWTSQPETDPELTVYSGTYEVLAVNRATRHVGMDHAKAPDAGGAPILKKMRSFAQDSGPGWMEYLANDPTGHLKVYKAYVALQGTNLVAAVIPK
jgi:hypothetical protein